MATTTNASLLTDKDPEFDAHIRPWIDYIITSNTGKLDHFDTAAMVDDLGKILKEFANERLDLSPGSSPAVQVAHLEKIVKEFFDNRLAEASAPAAVVPVTTNDEERQIIKSENGNYLVPMFDKDHQFVAYHEMASIEMPTHSPFPDMSIMDAAENKYIPACVKGVLQFYTAVTDAHDEDCDAAYHD